MALATCCGATCGTGFCGAGCAIDFCGAGVGNCCTSIAGGGTSAFATCTSRTGADAAAVRRLLLGAADDNCVFCMLEACTAIVFTGIGLIGAVEPIMSEMAWRSRGSSATLAMLSVRCGSASCCGCACGL